MKPVFAVAVGLLSVSMAARPVHAQRSYAIGFTGVRVEHSVRASSEVERNAGALFGGEASVTGPWLGVRGHLLGGSLTTESDVGDDRTVGEVGLEGSALALPWLAFTAGGVVRSYTAPIARQRWVALTTGMEAHVELLDGRVRGSARVGLMPAVHVSGLGAPDLAVQSAVSLLYRGGRVSGRLAYSLERFDFPKVNGLRRLEEVARLSATIGIRLAR